MLNNTHFQQRPRGVRNGTVTGDGLRTIGNTLARYRTTTNGAVTDAVTYPTVYPKPMCESKPSHMMMRPARALDVAGHTIDVTT
jgi:hypothetical protein